jgi:hypothetical protein
MAEVDFEKLLVDSSRALADLAVETIGDDPELLDMVYRLALRENGKTSMRAARVFDLADESRPGLARPYLDDAAGRIPEIKHTSVQRCLMRTLSRYPLTENEDILGRFYDFCFRLITSHTAPVAVRYYGMFFAYQTCLKEPDLKHELIPMLEEVIRIDSPGMKVRARDFLKDIIKRFGRD